MRILQNNGAAVALRWFYPPQHQFVQERDSREKLLPFYIHFEIAPFEEAFYLKGQKNIPMSSDHLCTSAVEYDRWFPLLDLDIETFGIISSSSNRALDFENLGEQEVKTSLKTLRSDCCNAFNIRDIHLHNFCLFGTSPSSISMCHLTKARKIPQLILNFWRECWWSWCFERPKAPGRKGQLWTWLKFWLCISSWSVSRW